MALNGYGELGMVSPEFTRLKRSARRTVSKMAETPHRSEKDLLDEFHMTIGYCVTAWGRVKNKIYRICQHQIGSKRNTAIIYYRLHGLKSRMDLADSLIKSQFIDDKPKSSKKDHPTLEIWKAIYKEISETLIPIRNRIAHHPIQIIGSSLSNLVFFGFPSATRASPRIAIGQDEELTERGAKHKTKPLLVADLEKHRIIVDEINKMLEDFVVLFQKHADQSSQS